jgi:hypothetical protein
MAVLADMPYIYDGQSWAARPLAPELQLGEGETQVVEIFFGRDNHPRLMGTRIAADGSTSAVYLRHRPSGWRREPSELGPLATAGSLYGVLGYADPEVVCAPGRFCLVKRVTGWARTSADAAPRRIFMTRVGPYKQVDGQLWQLVDDDWRKVLALAFEVVALCSAQDGKLWFVGDQPPGVFFVPKDKTEAIAFEQPVDHPSSLHCAPDGSVWIGGRTVALHRDDGIERLPGDVEDVSVIAGNSANEVWVGSANGLFVFRRDGR